MFTRAFVLITLVQWALLIVLGIALTSQGPPRDDLTTPVLVIGLVGLVGTLLAAYLAHNLRRGYARPLRELIEFVERVSKNPTGQRLLFPGVDDLARLARALNRLSERLAVRIAELEEDRQQLRTILSGMVEGVVALDADQRILFANERATQLLEFPNPGPIGRRLWEVVRQRPLLDIVQRALDRPEPHREEFNWNGSPPRSLTVHAARLPGYPPRGAVLVLHDTTDLRRLERLRQEFVANVSHELKTPLSVIKANVETLIDGAVDDAEHRGAFLRQINSQSDRLHYLILDLLSLARIESGEELFEFESVEVEAVAETCLDRHRTRAEARHQTLSLLPADPLPGEEPLSVWADEEAVDQILDNLLDNALKYTPEGGKISVGWHVRDGEVDLEVADTGIGIPAADLPRIFERFYRVDKARSREMGGTGLGLSIVKHLAQAMRGAVKATSQVGKGTTFIVTLPRAAPGPTESARATIADSPSDFHRIYTEVPYSNPRNPQ
jgi:two-component system, OmpR family, phosphate regulon sensor histidine kinase PhoR